uniref:Fucosyltransferase n=1 Tax=Panagrolaimus sp. PS1159 TaxID=55785 RepID=A0AC35FBC8_9BILA
MSYRRDSTIWKPYDRFEKLMGQEKTEEFWTEKQINEKLSKKSKLAVQFVSHCETHSLREQFIKKLDKYIDITTFGDCGNKTTDMKEQDILDQYYFYFAFENAVCKDYITEKFWRLKHLIVPVVLKRSILKGIIEDEYFIAADDFSTPEALANKLSEISENTTEYKKYLNWAFKYKKSPSNDNREFCKLCKIAVKKEKHQIPDIYQWWENESQCQFNFFNFSLKSLMAFS